MLLGFNDNIEYQGQVFHIQTEDSGIKNPHIFTYLYYKGKILDSMKISYEKELANTDLVNIVKKMMIFLHKEMKTNLFNHKYDEKIQQYMQGDTLENETSGNEKPIIVENQPKEENLKAPFPSSQAMENKRLDDMILDFLTSSKEPE